MTKTLLISFLVIVAVRLAAQSNHPGMLPIIEADFKPVSNLITPETEAIVLLDSGSSTIDGNPKNDFFLTYYHFRRILILKKSVLADIAKFAINYSEEMNGKILKTVKASTYNLENGKISKIDLQEKDYFFDHSKQYEPSLRFAYPDAREGSIIEFEYSVKGYYPKLENWYFQGDYPRLRSVYNVRVPDGFNFSIQTQNKKYLTNTTSLTFIKTFYVWTNFENTTVHDITWRFENIPPMREEVYTSTVDNYRACVKFQISAIPTQPGESKGIFNEWPWYANLLLKNGDFGKTISDPSTMIRKQAKLFAGENNTELQKAIGVFSNVRDHFRVMGDDKIYMTDDKNLSQIYNEGIGNVADINMVLTAMLKTQNIQADPVILATRDRGLTNQNYPVLANYNYLVCRTVIDGRIYYLDASSPYMAFGKLPSKCYNGHARVITKETFPVYLAPDSLYESPRLITTIRNSGNSNLLNLEWTKYAGFYESCEDRKQLKDVKKEQFFKKMAESTPLFKSLDSFSIENTNNMEEPLKLQYSLTLDPGKGDRIYLSPFFNYGLTENPFKSAERLYPVEMPYVPQDAYEFNMEIPKGYEIEEQPKSVKMILNENDGSYIYKIEVRGDKIFVSSSMKLNKAVFDSEDYPSLKEFYAAIIKKQSEMIVFKKKT